MGLFSSQARMLNLTRRRTALELCAAPNCSLNPDKTKEEPQKPSNSFIGSKPSETIPAESVSIETLLANKGITIDQLQKNTVEVFELKLDELEEQHKLIQQEIKAVRSFGVLTSGKTVTQPSRSSDEIKKELDIITKKIDETPKNYKTQKVNTVKYEGVCKSEVETYGSTKEIKKASVTLTSSKFSEIQKDMLKNATIKKDEKYGTVNVTFTNGKNYTNLMNSLKVESTEERKELIMTPELKELYSQQDSLQKEYTNALDYEILNG